MSFRTTKYIVDVDYDEISGNPLVETWRRASDKVIHRDRGPALIYYSPTSRVPTSSLWFRDGETHRDKADGPAMVRRDGVTGETISVHYFDNGNEIDFNPDY